MHAYLFNHTVLILFLLLKNLFPPQSVSSLGISAEAYPQLPLQALHGVSHIVVAQIILIEWKLALHSFLQATLSSG